MNYEKSLELDMAVHATLRTRLAVSWNAFFAPKGTPQAVVTLINTEVSKILAEPETRQRLMALGIEVAGGTPQELAARVRNEREKWSRIIRSANIKAD